MHVITVALVCLASAGHGRRLHTTGQGAEVRRDAESQQSGSADLFAQLLLSANPTVGWQAAGAGYARSFAPKKAIGNQRTQHSPTIAQVSQHKIASPRGQPPIMQAFSFDNFDRECIRVLTVAQTEASSIGATEFGTQHLLLAATMQKDDVSESLKRAGVTQDKLRQKLGRGNPLGGMFKGKKDDLLPFAEDAALALKASVKLAKGNEEVSWQELMMVVLQTETSQAVKLLKELELDPKKAYDEVKAGKRELVGAGGDRKKKKGKESTLSQCTTDLTEKAAAGLLDPLIGRQEQVKRAMQILCRRRKNNPVLIGDPGVGKTAIAEGLAQLIVDDQVPDMLKCKKLLSLELGLLVADTKYRGEFETKIKDVIEEVSKSNDTILFIDEIHTLVGAGGGDGGIDAANLMKPSLARGQLQCMGATTVDEYRKYIEKDAALERRFQPVSVDETSIEETLQILQRLAPKYEEHHYVSYSPDALEAASKLAERYLPDRFLPDKAIDLMDEAGSLKQLDDIGSMSSSNAEMTVSEEDVAAVISEWTGIPVSKLTADEAKSMLDVESDLHDRVIGQDFAVSAIARALRRARVGLRSQRRPVASMIFCGPTGVGKTELAKAVAELYYGDEKAMIRLDMSEYMQPNSVTRLTGPPPGYVGYEEGGQLTGAVRRNPHSVVLFDEVEKAHPDVFNTLLQVLDDGRLTDNKGRTVDFSNTMLILTSNVGSRKILRMVGTANASPENREEEYAAMRAAVKDELGKGFRPEFLNRLDEVIVFEGLKIPEANDIAGLMLKELAGRCKECEIELSTTDKLTTALVESGYSTTYGARPLRRAVQRICEDAVAEAVLDGFAKEGEKLVIDHDGEETVILINQKGSKRKFMPSSAQGIEEDVGIR